MNRKMWWAVWMLLLPGWSGIADDSQPLRGEWDFQPECVWSQTEWKGQPWGKPQAVLILGNGNVAVFDPMLKKNILLNAKGSFLATFAPAGEGPREVRRQSFWFSRDGRVIIPDMGVVHYFDEQGQWQESIRTAPMPQPRGFIDADHMVMVPRTAFEVGGGQGYFSVIDLRDKANSRNLFEISRLFGGGFVRTGKDVMDILVSGLSPMIEVGIGPDFMVYGSSGEYRLTLIDFQGREIGHLRLDRRKAHVSHARIAEHLRSPHLPEDKVMELARSFPEELVYFEDIRVVDDHIWVQQAGLDSHPRALVFDIFSSAGEYLYRAELRLPEGEFLKSPFHNLDFRGDRLVAVVEHEDDSLSVSSYRIHLPQ